MPNQLWCLLFCWSSEDTGRDVYPLPPLLTFMPSTKTGFPSWSFVHTVNSAAVPTFTGSEGNTSSEASGSTARSGWSQLREGEGEEPFAFCLECEDYKFLITHHQTSGLPQDSHSQSTDTHTRVLIVI